jgi:hypothetical protein
MKYLPIILSCFILRGIPTHAQECSATNVDGTTTVVSQRVLRCQK